MGFQTPTLPVAGNPISVSLFGAPVYNSVVELWPYTTAGQLAQATSGTELEAIEAPASQEYLGWTTGNKWGPVSTRLISISLLDIATNLEVEDGVGAFYFTIPVEFNGFNLVTAHASTPGAASTSGKPTFQIHNVTDSVDMLSTEITIDQDEFTSYTAATQPVVDPTHDDLATGDLLRFDCDLAGTGTKGLTIFLTVALP